MCVLAQLDDGARAVRAENVVVIVKEINGTLQRLLNQLTLETRPYTPFSSQGYVVGSVGRKDD